MLKKILFLSFLLINSFNSIKSAEAASNFKTHLDKIPKSPTIYEYPDFVMVISKDDNKTFILIGTYKGRKIYRKSFSFKEKIVRIRRIQKEDRSEALEIKLEKGKIHILELQYLFDRT